MPCWRNNVNQRRPPRIGFRRYSADIARRFPVAMMISRRQTPSALGICEQCFRRRTPQLRASRICADTGQLRDIYARILFTVAGDTLLVFDDAASCERRLLVIRAHACSGAVAARLPAEITSLSRMAAA